MKPNENQSSFPGGTFRVLPGKSFFKKAFDFKDPRKTLLTLLLMAAVAAAFYFHFRTEREAPPPDVRKLPSSPIRVGAPLPEFHLEDLEGNLFNTHAHLGKPMVMTIWATWCVPCVKEMETIRELLRKHEGKGIVVLAVSVDQCPVEEIRRFVENRRVPFKVLLGGKQMELLMEFGKFERIPATFLIDGEGIVRSKLVGLRDKKEMEKALEAILRQKSR